MLIWEATLSGSFFEVFFNLLNIGKIQTASKILSCFFNGVQVCFFTRKKPE